MARRRRRSSKKGCGCPKGSRRVRGGACLGKRGKFVRKHC